MPQLNLVLEGGGVKGIGLVGALARLEEEKIEIAGVAGTSAGAIVASLFAAGYGSDELREVLTQKDFSGFLDGMWLAPVRFWFKFGIYRGKEFHQWLYKLLQRKGVVNFADVRGRDLKVVASDVAKKEILILDKQGHPHLAVADAVRMSISLPLFFEAYQWGSRLMVDGGTPE
jgi:NTE family protein